MYVFSEVLAVVAELYTFHLFMLGTFYKRDKPLIAWLGAYGLFGLILTLLSFVVNASYIRLLFCVIAMTCVGISLFDAKPLQSIYASLSFGCLYVLTDVLMHSAAPNGSWCGDQRQLSAANGTLN